MTVRWVLVIGAIYNYKDLRAELSGLGYEFFSYGDTEVILTAYHAWGEDCVDRLHGMFAFAIWRCERKSPFLTRDRFGIKPLYYSQDSRCIRFAFNTQALLAAGGSVAIRRTRLLPAGGVVGRS